MIVKIKSQPFSNLKYVSYITTLGYFLYLNYFDLDFLDFFEDISKMSFSLIFLVIGGGG